MCTETALICPTMCLYVLKNMCLHNAHRETFIGSVVRDSLSVTFKC